MKKSKFAISDSEKRMKKDIAKELKKYQAKLDKLEKPEKAPKKNVKRPIFKYLEIIIFEPGFVKNEGYDLDDSYPLKYGEQVLYLGEIPNSPDHIAIAKHCGNVVWLMHSSDFRKAKEEEL